MSPGLVGWLRRRFADDTLTERTGIRGAGALSQADFGQPISNEDLLFAVQREPVAYRTVFQVAHDVFDKWFKLEEISEKPDPDFDRLAQYALADLNAKAVLTRMAVFERLAGWAIIVVGYVDHGKSLADPLENPSEIRELAPYMGDVQVTVQSTDEDKDPNSPRFGLPVYYTLNRGAGFAQQKVHFTRVIHFATRLLVHPYKGLSVLEPIYDDSQAWRNIRWGMGQTIFRYGSGFPDVEVMGANKKMLDDLEASQQFTNLQSRTYFLHSDKTKLEFKGLAGRALDPEPYCQAILESLSTGTCIPTAMLRGVQAGALTGSGVNEREYFKLISDLQSLYEPGVWELIDTLLKIGQIPAKPEDYEIRWLGGFEINEIDKSTVELNRARADDLRSMYMTVNELRARQNPPLKALPEPEGNVIPGSLKKQESGFSQSQNVTEETKSAENRN